MRRRANPTQKPAQDEPRYGVRETPTGTLCPVDGCGLPQWTCPGGVTCDGEHGGADLGDWIEQREADQSIAGAAFEHLSEDPPKGSISGDLGVVERDFEINFDGEYRALKKALTLKTPADQASLGVLTR